MENNNTIGMPDLFGSVDGGLRDVCARELVRRVLPRAIAEGRISDADFKFLREWKSGTYFQTRHEVPILFEYDESISDISKRLKVYYRFGYFKDVSIVHEGVKFRLLATYSERSLPVWLQWFMERGYTESELRGIWGLLPFDSKFADGDNDPSVDYFGHLDAEARSFKAEPKLTQAALTIAISADDGRKMMSKLKRTQDGSIAARDIKRALQKQMKMHQYTPSKLADGAGLPRKFVTKWSWGQMLIRPNELQAMCDFMGIDNIFHGISY